MQNNELQGRREAPLTAEVDMQGANAIQHIPTTGAEAGAPHDDVSILGVPDLEVLQLILDRSLRVHARSHFFVWAQGILQALLPHETLVCALAGTQAGEFTIDVLSSAPLPPGAAEILRKPRAGFVDSVARDWLQAGRRPFVYERTAAALAPEDSQAVADGAGPPCANFAAHGLCGVDGSLTSLFVLLDLPGTVGARQIYLLETLLPFLHVTWLRVHLGQPRAVQPVCSPRTMRNLTMREVEVINWVHDGKSNSQIATMLKISPLTVKNHVQKILRKLNVQNRTQAVAKSMALNILDSSRRP
jgi:transcriptional regulator EpsA